jgi:hypothetical protein
VLVGSGVLSPLKPRTAVFGCAFAGATWAFGGVPTIAGGEGGDCGELASGAATGRSEAGGVLEDEGVLGVVVVVSVVVVESVVVSSFVQWSSFTPPLLPCASQSFPFSDG